MKIFHANVVISHLMQFYVYEIKKNMKSYELLWFSAYSNQQLKYLILLSGSGKQNRMTLERKIHLADGVFPVTACIYTLYIKTFTSSSNIAYRIIPFVR